MNPALTIGNATIWLGECREVMKTLPADSVQCVVTSPPYFGLRDYGTASWEGGDDACDHLAPAAHGYDPHATSTLGPKHDGISPTNTAHQDATKRQQFRAACGKCGAVRVDQQIGLEATPAEYVATMVDVFREIRRILRPDGVVWLNLGDSYANDTKWGGSTSGLSPAALHGTTPGNRTRRQTGILPKSLIGIPWRTAFALQDDGWYLRAEIIWAKPNPMPESVTDRVSRSHEQLFMLTKSPRYYYDKEAIAEQRVRPGEKARYTWQERKERGESTRRGNPADSGPQRHSGGVGGNGKTRNARSVWTITPATYKGVHYAVMPDELAKRRILASTSDQACDVCGAPWKRLVETSNPSKEANIGPDMSGGAALTGNPQTSKGMHRNGGGVYSSAVTIGWAPTCKCPTNHGLGRCIVFDPFAGAGTTPKVAITHGRTAWGSDLNPANIELIAERLDGVALRLV